MSGWRFVVGGLRGWMVGGWRFARLVVCAVGGLGGWRVAGLVSCAVGGLRGWRLVIDDIQWVVGGWWLAVGG